LGKKIDIPVDNNIIEVPLEEAMPDNYLPYAVEVSKDRALPDVRDGLKPVHRRILYGAHILKAYPDKPYYKSARIVGDILGRYHPHGDTSVYDAMVILAQDFTTRYPLIDGHGNWGSQDGDSAAAMRYTEARLTPIAMEMLKDIDKDVVNMVENYSASELEPEVLPAKYPNLLVNGAFGIAVGLATNIPPHNLREVVDATLLYIDNNEVTTKDLMEYVKAPDLPTGGIIIGKDSLYNAYETGEGKVTLRSKTKIELLESGRLGIVITEFPYRRNKAKILETISIMTGDKKHQKALESIIDIRDESDRTGTRAVIELKKSVDIEAAEKVLKYLFMKTELQVNISFNMVALASGKPMTMGLKTILMHYVNHRKEVITRRTKKELEIAEKRFHIVEGFIKAIDIIDKIIATIRASKSKKDSIENLVKEYAFTEIQAEAIVELMLYRLTGLEIKTFLKEYKELEKLIKYLKNILENEKELLKVIKKELKEVRDTYGDDRRTEIIEDDSQGKIDLEELIIVEDTIITMSNEGFIKRVPQKSYERFNYKVEDIEYREGDFNKFLLNSNTKHILMFFTNLGNMYQLRSDIIKEFKWKEKGERLDSLIKGLDFASEQIINVFSIENTTMQKDFQLFTSKGNIKKTALDKFNSSYSKIMALKLRNGETLVDVQLFDREKAESFIKVNTEIGLCFTIEEPKLEAVERNILGISLFNLSEKDNVTNIEYINNYEFEHFKINVTENGIIKLSKYSKLNSKTSQCSTDSKSYLLLFTNKGNVIKMPSAMLQNLSPEGISIASICDGYDEKHELILNVLSLKDFNEGLDVMFFTKNGFIKKTSLSEFEGDYLVTTAYRFRGEKDTLINVEFANKDEDCDIIIVTAKAMSIRFKCDTVNYMGKIASGVTAISLNEDDEVIYGFIFNKNCSKIELKAKSKEVSLIPIDDIKIQNRAGRGKNIMLVVLGDYIIDVKLK
jgi:topoisomerase-4 subunit A